MADLRHTDFVRDDVLPSYWANAIQQMLGSGAFNFYATAASATSVSVLGGAALAALTGSVRAAIAVDGKWRWRDSTVSRAVPALPPGTLNVYVVALDNDITNVPDPFTDETDYSFDIRIGTAPPALEPGVFDIVQGPVAVFDWDGAAIVTGTLRTLVTGTRAAEDLVGTLPSQRTLGTGARQAAAGNDARLAGSVPIGGMIPYAGSGDLVENGAEFMRPDGRLVDKTTYATFFGRVGHAYNSGVDPGSNKVRLPDKRGRGSVGADDMGTGAAGRLPNSNRARGQNGGEEQHTLSNAETPLRDHTHDLGGASVPTVGGGAAVALGDGGTVRGAITQTGSISGGGLGGAAHNNMQPYEVDSWLVRVA